LNPYALMKAFLSGSTPPCQQITMQTIDINNNKSAETHYVTLSDISNMDPCIFPNKKNSITGQSCRETFQSLHETPEMSHDFIDQVYFASLALVGIYIFYKIMEKSP